MKHTSKTNLTALFGAMLIALSACSESGTTDPVADSADQGTAETDSSEGESTPTEVLEDESAYVLIPEGTNLRINYANESYEVIADPDYLLSQWNGMKNCLQVDAPDPYVLIEREVVPVSGATDTLQMPDQSYAASVLDREFDAFVQIIVDDFDPETADRGYFFRQIIGPYMWRYNGYSERSYDPRCAAFVVR